MVVQIPEHEQANTNKTKSPFVFRIHLVRHGETEANRAGIVLGQIDSPLTNLGIQQAKAAHQTFGKKHNQFWKIFSSDLGRCVRTSNLILGLEDNDNGKNKEGKSFFNLDKRLRERGKGVREGQSIHLTYEEAMQSFQERNRKRCDGNGNGEIVENISLLPLLENENQVMDRVNDWIEENIRDAYSHYCNEGGVGIPYDVLAISHSGTLRILIENLVGKQLPHDVERDKVGKEGSQGGGGRLMIPNTSKTIIEFTMLGSDDDSADEESYGPIRIAALKTEKGHEFVSSHGAKLVDFTNVSHFEYIVK